jgi:hypothetical protein
LLTFFFSSFVLGKTILVPLTNSLYVPGKLSDPDHVIVDVGTGYYVQKVRHQAHPISPTQLIFSFPPVSSTSTKTLFNQSGLHQDEFGGIGGYDTKETRKYELFG